MIKWSRVFPLALVVVLAACSAPTSPFPEPDEPDKPGGPDDPKTGMVVPFEVTYLG